MIEKICRIKEEEIELSNTIFRQLNFYEKKFTIKDESDIKA
jgi:hypothetical protein